MEPSPQMLAELSFFREYSLETLRLISAYAMHVRLDEGDDRAPFAGDSPMSPPELAFLEVAEGIGREQAIARVAVKYVTGLWSLLRLRSLSRQEYRRPRPAPHALDLEAA